MKSTLTLAFRSPSSLLAIGMLLAGSIACTATTEVAQPASASPSSIPSESESGDEPAPTGDTPELRASVDARILKTLREGGLDLAKLPANLDTLLPEPGHVKLHAVMKSFTIALGTTCDGCHVKDAETLEDFHVDTPRKQIARKMWTRFVMGLKKEDGTNIFCDTCHQGKITFLDRSDKSLLANWMKTNFVDGLVSKDGTEHGCTTCHGEGSPAPFLDSWKRP